MVTSLEQAARSAASDRGISVAASVLGDAGRVFDGPTGPRQVDWKALRHYVGQSRLTMASAMRYEATGYEIGAVSPFALARPVRVMLDESVTQEEEISIGSGVRSTTVILLKSATCCARSAMSNACR